MQEILFVGILQITLTFSSVCFIQSKFPLLVPQLSVILLFFHFYSEYTCENPSHQGTSMLGISNFISYFSLSAFLCISHISQYNYHVTCVCICIQIYMSKGATSALGVCNHFILVILLAEFIIQYGILMFSEVKSLNSP